MSFTNPKTMGPPLFLSGTWIVCLDINRTGSSEVRLYSMQYRLTALFPFERLLRLFGLIFYLTNQNTGGGDS